MDLEDAGGVEQASIVPVTKVVITNATDACGKLSSAML